jgi:hypothetical protein
VATTFGRLLRDATFWSRIQTYALMLTFAVVTGQRVIGSYVAGTLAIDLRIYRAAVIAVANGQSPWSASVDGYAFAGTPPALLAFAPAALLPEPVAIVLYWGLFAAAAVLAIRLLGLPIWWVLFPPLAEAVVLINTDALVLLLLLATGPVAGAAVALKSYAAVPLLLQRRWRALVVGALLSAVTFPLWLDFLREREAITATLAAQAYGGLSAWGTWFMIPTAIALIGLRGRGASWLAVPALWPYTQLHYAAIALPAARRSFLLAFLLCFPYAFLPAAAVVLEFLRVTYLELRARRTRATPATSVATAASGTDAS